MANGQPPSQEPGFVEEEPLQGPPPEEERRKKSGTPMSTWVAVFGSSTVFHALLLILLGMIIIGAPEEEQEEVTVQIPQESEEDKEKITMQKKVREVEQESQVENPEVQQQEAMEDMEAEQPQKQGQSLDFSSNTNNNKEVEKAIALGGGGGGGTYGSRGGGSASQVGGGGGKPATQHAVDAALKWLAKHQNDKGFWDADNYDNQCPEGNKCKRSLGDSGTNDVGVTGLSLLAFLGAGYTHESDEKLGGMHMGNVVHKGLRWLKDRQKDNGAFDGGGRQMYNHAIAAMAYAEAYGMTASPRLEGIAQKGIDFLEHAQNESGGKRLAWRYKANDGENDTSVTGWCAMALKSAELAGLETNKAAMKGALRWVKQNTNKRGLTGYTSKITSRDQAYKRRAMISVGMLIRMFANDELYNKQLKILKQAADYVVTQTPEWNDGAEFKSSSMDFYHWYYGSLALFMFAGPDTRFEQLGYWQKWNQPMQKAVLTGQQKPSEGHEIGSWDPVSRWAHHGAGRVYVTALNALTLEVYYRYDNALFN